MFFRQQSIQCDDSVGQRQPVPREQQRTAAIREDQATAARLPQHTNLPGHVAVGRPPPVPNNYADDTCANLQPILVNSRRTDRPSSAVEVMPGFIWTSCLEQHPHLSCPYKYYTCNHIRSSPVTVCYAVCLHGVTVYVSTVSYGRKSLNG